MSDHLKPIGVIGGMGPEATILFMSKIVASVDANDDSDHIPLIVHNNTQVSSRIKHLIEGNGKDPTSAIAATAKLLTEAGACALAMPCNTAHYYAPAIYAATDLPFLNMLELSSSKAAEKIKPPNIVGMLGSPALQISAVFEEYFIKHGLRSMYSAHEDKLLLAIRSVKKNGVTSSAVHDVQICVDDLIASGASVILICCTEFSLMTDQINSSVPIIDTLDVLAEACVEFSTAKRIERKLHNQSQTVHRSGTLSVQTSNDLIGKETTKC